MPNVTPPIQHTNHNINQRATRCPLEPKAKKRRLAANWLRSAFGLALGFVMVSLWAVHQHLRDTDLDSDQSLMAASAQGNFQKIATRRKLNPTND